MCWCFRGLFGPGLIEAAPQAGQERIICRVSGAFSAPASLKHHPRRLLNTDKLGFRGLFGPGLIEALLALHEPLEGCGVSGAFSAPASLKLPPCFWEFCFNPGFRGLFGPGLIEAFFQARGVCLGDVSGAFSAPASLKPGFFTRGDPILRAFPGPFRPRPH